MNSRASIACTALLLPSLALAQDVGSGLQVSGSNTLKFEHYSTAGDRSASPYPFDGGQTYDEFNINLGQRFGAYDRWRAQVSGAVNDSDYRSAHKGIVPERLSFTREKGDAPIPYRVEAGDIFGYFSYRTLQRSLKGVQLELQPVRSVGGWRQSFQILAGTNQSDWRDLRYNDNANAGFSWLAQSADGRNAFGLNVLNTFRQANTGTATPARSQQVVSVVGQTGWLRDGMSLKLDGEIAKFRGDHEGLTGRGAASGVDRSDTAVFLQASGGISRPLSYRFLYERYGQDYRPANAVITPDRESREGHLSYRLAGGLMARARVQRYVDARESASPQHTHTAGLNLSGRLLEPLIAGTGISGSLDAFVQSIRNSTPRVDTRSSNLRLDLAKSFAGGWNGQFGLFLQDLDDRSGAGAGSGTRQLSLAGSHAVSMGPWRGSMTPGVALRNLRGTAGDGTDIVPTFSTLLAHGPHSVDFNLGLNQQNRNPVGSIDVGTVTLNVGYQFATKSDQFRFEISRFDRNPNPGATTNAYRLSALWTHHFDSANAAAGRTSTSGAVSVAAGGAADGLLALAPGISVEEARRRLAAQGFSGSTRAGRGLEVFEARMLDEIDQRQRVVLESVAGELERAVLIIEFDDVGNRDSTAQTFERVRQSLTRRFGAPVTFFERGGFGPGFVADLNADRFIRVVEWEAGNARIRFGIPRRVNGQARIEIQIARDFGVSTDTRWGLDEVF